MRRLSPFLLALALAAACDRADSQAATLPAGSKPASALVFESIGNDLGTVVWPDGVDTNFKFKNRGSHIVKIIDYYANCGCANPRLRILKDGKIAREGHGRGEATGPLLEVNPGEAGELFVRFETRGLSGEAKEHYSMVTLVTDENAGPIGLFIKAAIERKYEVVPAQVMFDSMGAKQTQTKGVKIYALLPGAAAPFDAKIISAPPFIRAEPFEYTVGQQRPYVEIGLLAGPGLKREVLQGEVIVEGKFGRPKNDDAVRVTIPVFVPVVGDVQVKPALFDFQVVDPGKPAKAAPVTLQFLDPDRTLKLGEATIDGDGAAGLKLECKQLPPSFDAGSNKSVLYSLVLSSAAGFESVSASGVHGLVRIPTNLDEMPEVRLTYRALARPVPPRK
ncbi:MAG: DUF1573 domain-containing protein [Planctomycetes bacterium]|nr:DUF1573 domain-containing protein [Planctomycetota bacterium]